jgi:hypothetical protein
MAADAFFAALCSAFADGSTECSDDEPTPPTPSAEAMCPWPRPMSHHKANAVLHPITGAALSYCQQREGPDGRDWV